VRCALSLVRCRSLCQSPVDVFTSRDAVTVRRSLLQMLTQPCNHRGSQSRVWTRLLTTPKPLCPCSACLWIVGNPKRNHLVFLTSWTKAAPPVSLSVFAASRHVRFFLSVRTRGVPTPSEDVVSTACVRSQSRYTHRRCWFVSPESQRLHPHSV